MHWFFLIIVSGFGLTVSNCEYSQICPQWFVWLGYIQVPGHVHLCSISICIHLMSWAFLTDFCSLFLCCNVTPLFKVRGGLLTWRIPLTCLTLSHPVCTCACPESGACNSVVVVCWCVTYLFFAHFYTYSRTLVFSFDLFYVCHFGAFYRWLCGMGFAHCWRPYGDL